MGTATLGILLIGIIPTPIDYIFAQDLITSDFNFTEETQWLSNYPISIQAATIDIAIKHEILNNYYAYKFIGEYRPEYKRNGLYIAPSETLYALRDRYNDLKDIPKIGDYPLPDRKLCSYYYDTSHQFSKYIEEKMKWENDRKDFYDIVLFETKQLKTIWYELYLIKSTNDVYSARMGLKTIKDLLGNEDFYNFNLPPPVPVWRFNERGHQ